jgi:hypothetical protein
MRKGTAPSISAERVSYVVSVSLEGIGKQAEDSAAFPGRQNAPVFLGRFGSIGYFADFVRALCGNLVIVFAGDRVSNFDRVVRGRHRSAL